MDTELKRRAGVYIDEFEGFVSDKHKQSLVLGAERVMVWTRGDSGLVDLRNNVFGVKKKEGCIVGVT